MNDRERLIELLKVAMCKDGECVSCEGFTGGILCDNVYYSKRADHLIANGVTFQKQGEWISQDNRYVKFMCSVCKGKNYDGSGNYCPNCGAKMDADA